jgi:hypothetical protein
MQDETLNINKVQKKKRPLQKDEEFVEYRFVKNEIDGSIKRKKVIKKTTKKIKQLTEE